MADKLSAHSERKGMSNPFPWREAMTLGLGVLRMPPEQFWRMTPREFAAALRGIRGDLSPPLDRAAFDELRERFPDRGGSRT
jgi:uncharacterized phage protein (TIGR02216 family)